MFSSLALSAVTRNSPRKMQTLSSAAHAASSDFNAAALVLPPGAWHHAHMDPHHTPMALWGASAIAQHNETALFFGGEAPLGLARHRSDGLWAINLTSPTLDMRPVAHVGRGPAARRQHTAAPLPDGEMLVVGGAGESGTPLSEAWTWASGSSTWVPSGLEPSALLARAGHTMTALPAPAGPVYLRGANDAAFVIFGGLTTSRVAALMRRAPSSETSPAEYVAAAAADAAEPDAGSVALNDLVLLSRGARRTWRYTPLSIPDEISCSANGPLPRPTTWRRTADTPGGALQPDPVGGFGGASPWAVAEIGLLDPTTLSEAEAAAMQAASAARAHRPCGRSGHSAHLYTGRIAGVPPTACTRVAAVDSDGRGASGVGCLLIYAGGASSDHGQRGGAFRLDDLWILPIDSSWARTRDAPRVPSTLPWLVLRPSVARGALAPPRSSHAAVLHKEYLFTIGGEAARTAAGGPADVALSVDEYAMWQLHLPSLVWTPIHAASATGAHGLPRPSAGMTALLASLAVPSPPSPPHDEIYNSTDVPVAAPAIMLLGGAATNDDAHLALWVYRLGLPCSGQRNSTRTVGEGEQEEEEGYGCPRGQQCDATSGVCLCADGLPPTPHTVGCIRKPSPPAGLTFKPGAWRMVGDAWAIVGMSAVGGLVGQWGMGRMVATRGGAGRR